MKHFLSFLLILVFALSMTGGTGYADKAENIWNETINYVNRSAYTDDQLVDRGLDGTSKVYYKTVSNHYGSYGENNGTINGLTTRTGLFPD